MRIVFQSEHHLKCPHSSVRLNAFFSHPAVWDFNERRSCGGRDYSWKNTDIFSNKRLRVLVICQLVAFENTEKTSRLLFFQLITPQADFMKLYGALTPDSRKPNRWAEKTDRFEMTRRTGPLLREYFNFNMFYIRKIHFPAAFTILCFLVSPVMLKDTTTCQVS